MNKLPITVVIPIKNEEQNLKECLKTLTDFEHILLVDSGSEDNSVEIAKSSGVTVLQFQWNGRPPKKRNWVLRNNHIQTPWVLFLDADERVTPEFIQELRQTIDNPNIVGYWLSYRDHFQQKSLRFGIPFRKLALFRVGSGEYETVESTGQSALDMEIHEHPVLSGSTGLIKSPLLHFDYKNLARYLSKHNEYAQWETDRYFYIRGNKKAWESLTSRQKTKYRNLSKTWFPFLYFLVQYILKFGFLDGKSGLDFAVMKFFYFYQIKCRIQERMRLEKRIKDPNC